jgi:hypothetical protein
MRYRWGMFKNHDSRNAAVALALMALLGVALVFLFTGSPEQDSGYHFLIARAAWSEPVNFVKVWARPFYTLVFAAPAALGWTAARLFAVALGVAVAWQTWRLALDLKMERAWLVVPLLLGQPVFFELYPDLLTEPLFALVFVVALRWHLRGWKKRGMLAASLLPLARPEGVFLCLLWGKWILADAWKNESAPPARKIFRAVIAMLPLATGVTLWWLAALVISRDPLFILHDWPSQWQQGTYGRGTIFSYAARALEFSGPLLAVPLLAGIWNSLRLKKWTPVVTPWLLFFILHSLFRAYGLFGEAGYPRYMVSVAPATAVLALLGWNALAMLAVGSPLKIMRAFATTILAISIAVSFLYRDSLIWSRDGAAIRDIHAWLRENPHDIRRFVWSNAEMCAQLGRGIGEQPVFTADHEKNLALLRASPSGTLVMWDDYLGPDWFRMTALDIEAAGYQRLRTQQYALRGVILHGEIAGWKLTREVEITALYKP